MNKKQYSRHVIFLTKGQARGADIAKRTGKSFKLRFTPLQREFNARYATGFFDSVWSGIKSVGKTVADVGKKVVKKGAEFVQSDAGQALLKGVDMALVSEGIPPLASGLVTTAANMINKPKPVEESPPSYDESEDYQQVTAPSVSRKVPKSGGNIFSKAKVGVTIPNILQVGNGVPKPIQTPRGIRYQMMKDGRSTFISKEEYDSIMGSKGKKSGKSLSIPSVRSIGNGLTMPSVMSFN
jgi:hypothetical protein